MDTAGTSRRATRKPTRRLSTGVPGLDDILLGGLTAERLYLVEGSPGAGKTTLGLQFLLDGVAKGERGMYVTLSETADELDAVAESHGWSIDDIDVFELAGETVLAPDVQQSVLYPFEVELGETTRGVLDRVDQVKPARLVFDSLSELRLLAQDPLRYRREILALKQFFVTHACTVLLLDDKTASTDQHLHSISHGVISLEQIAQEFGRERRRVNVLKMRGTKFRGGYHDYVLDTGGIRMFPRLIAGDEHGQFTGAVAATGSPGLDTLLGGGLSAGTSTLIVGPSGVGKTTVTVCAMLAALERGESAAFYLFDEGVGTFLARNAALGQDLRPHLASGRLLMRHVEPAELAPGEFAQMLREAVECSGVSFIAIDSLNAYMQAMPGERYLALQMHELLAYLNLRNVTTLLVLGEHGLPGEVQRDVDLSYLSDATVLLRFFEAGGKLRRAIAVIKSRTANHALTIHELAIDTSGIRIGAPLSGFEGILTGLPHYRGDIGMMVPADDAPR